MNIKLPMQLHDFDLEYGLNWKKVEIQPNAYFSDFGFYKVVCINTKVPKYEIYNFADTVFPHKVAIDLSLERFIEKLQQLRSSNDS